MSSNLSYETHTKEKGSWFLHKETIPFFAFIRRSIHKLPLYKRFILTGKIYKFKYSFSKLDFIGDLERGLELTNTGRLPVTEEYITLTNGILAPRQGNKTAQNYYHTFEWLNDLAQAGTKESAATAKYMLRAWSQKWNKYVYSWSADRAVKRGIAVLNAWYMLSENNTSPTDPVLYSIVFSHKRHIKFILPTLTGVTELLAVQFLLGFYLHAKGEYPNYLRTKLLTILQEQFYPDGGYCLRNPRIQVIVFKALLSIKTYIDQSNFDSEIALNTILTRVKQVAHLMIHKNGELVCFNGSDKGQDIINDALKTLIIGEENQEKAQDKSQDKPQEKAPYIAPYTGFMCLENQHMKIIADVGYPQAPHRVDKYIPFNGTGGIELSYENHVVFQNCGYQEWLPQGWQDGLRQSVAHNTLSIDDFEHTDINKKGIIIRSPRNIQGSQLAHNNNLWLEYAHDGFMNEYGLMYQRRLFMDTTKTSLTGEELLTTPTQLLAKPKPHNAILNFHIHPDIAVLFEKGDNIVIFILPNGSQMKFICNFHDINILEGVNACEKWRLKRNLRMEITIPITSKTTQIKWAIQPLSNHEKYQIK